MNLPRLAAKDARDALAAEQAKATNGERERADLLRQLANLERSLGDEKAKASRGEGKAEWLQEQVKGAERQGEEARQALRAATEEATAALQETKEARAAVAAEQAKAVGFEREKADLLRQLATLEHAVSEERARASKLEGRLEVMEAQVVPQTAGEMKAKLTRKGIGERPH